MIALRHTHTLTHRPDWPVTPPMSRPSCHPLSPATLRRHQVRLYQMFWLPRGDAYRLLASLAHYLDGRIWPVEDVEEVRTGRMGYEE